MPSPRPPAAPPARRATRAHPGGYPLDGPATGLAFLRAAPFALVALIANVLLPGTDVPGGPLLLVLLWSTVPTMVAVGMHETWRTDGVTWVAQRTYTFAWRKVELARLSSVLADPQASLFLPNSSSVRISDSRGGWVRVTDQRGWGPVWAELMGRRLKERGWQKALWLDEPGYGVYQELSGDRRSLKRHREVYGTDVPLVSVGLVPAAQYHRPDGTAQTAGGDGPVGPPVAPWTPVPGPSLDGSPVRPVSAQDAPALPGPEDRPGSEAVLAGPPAPRAALDDPQGPRRGDGGDRRTYPPVLPPGQRERRLPNRPDRRLVVPAIPPAGQPERRLPRRPNSTAGTAAGPAAASGPGDRADRPSP